MTKALNFATYQSVNTPVNHATMKKQKVTIEHELRSNSPNIIWNLISTEGGLAKWIADIVDESDGMLTFRWGEEWARNEVRRARIVRRVRHEYIRLKWEDDDDKDAFLEFRMMYSDLTGDYILCVTDFAYEEEMDSLHTLWEQNFEQLRQSSGL